MTIELDAQTPTPLLLNQPKYQGKVRDIYSMGARKLIVTSDRLSAFDRGITTIPYKGQVLNLISRFWFEATASIIRNHMVAVPYANAMLVKSLKMFPVEFIVRAYLTGSTKTSIWTLYKEGQRNFNGYQLPDGMKKNQRLPEIVITPTIKSATHDNPVTFDQIIEDNLMTQEQLDKTVSAITELFNFASSYSKARGLLLVDSKFELGLDDNQRVVLGDELFTPDSSRYWRLSSYASAYNQNKSPESYDKEIIRLYLSKVAKPYLDETLPTIPDELRQKLSERYISLYEKLLGKPFDKQALRL